MFLVHRRGTSSGFVEQRAYVDRVDVSLRVFMMVSVGALPFKEIEPNSGNTCTATVVLFL